MKKLLLILSLLPLTMWTLSAQEFDKDNPTAPYLNTITTAAPFLLIAPDARGGAMGDMGVATSPDNYSQHHNPSKYVFNKEIFGIGLAYSPWLKSLINDIHLAYLSTFFKPTENDAIAFALRYFSLGEIQFTNENGTALYTANPNEFTLDFTYARKLSKIVSMAITPRFVYSNLGSGFQSQSAGYEMKAGLAGAVDISLFVDKEFFHQNGSIKNSELLFGLNISNIGNKVSYTGNTESRDFLPCNLRMGLSYIMNIDDYNTLTLNTEIGKLLVPSLPILDTATGKFYGNGKNRDEINPITGIARSFFDGAGGYKINPTGCFMEELRELAWSFGIEYSYRNILFVRSGTFIESKYKGNRKFITVGAGVKYNIFSIDVSYLFALTQNHPLENSMRFSLTFMLDSFNKENIKTQGKLN
ncbi:MAG: type IX secretion system outer membrane channel protein PorV [Bacteroidetes bacterium]|nr:type IX secretion system outer membrane channel protein PorV [Bacteroidota bacterium]MCL1968723.1 type IX secretion system outer membrane channel protein PorV [Bacteroidota bacterium]